MKTLTAVLSHSPDLIPLQPRSLHEINNTLMEKFGKYVLK